MVMGRVMVKILRIVLAMSFLVAAMAMAGCSSEYNTAPSNAAEGSAPGNLAPDFQLKDFDGRDVKLSEFRGSPVMLNFWATWCPPCRAETPDIQAVYEEKRGQGLVVIALSIGEDGDTVRDYAERTGLTFTTGLDTDTAAAATYRIVGIPTHFFVDAEGVLRDWRIGSMSKGTMEEKVEEIMSTGIEGSGS